MEDDYRQFVLEFLASRPLLSLVAAAVVGVGATANHYHRREAPARIEINGTGFYEGDAVFRSDHIMFPMRFAQKAGVHVFYDPRSRIAVLRQADDNIAVKAGSDTMLMFLSNGDHWLNEGSEAGLGVPFEPLRLPAETAPIHEGSELCIPLRVIAATLHVDPKQVRWDPTTRTASFTSPSPLYGPADAPRVFTAPRFLADAFSEPPGGS
jgi:hypothetical protein